MLILISINSIFLQTRYSTKKSNLHTHTHIHTHISLSLYIRETNSGARSRAFIGGKVDEGNFSSIAYAARYYYRKRVSKLIDGAGSALNNLWEDELNNFRVHLWSSPRSILVPNQNFSSSSLHPLPPLLSSFFFRERRRKRTVPRARPDNVAGRFNEPDTMIMIRLIRAVEAWHRWTQWSTDRPVIVASVNGISQFNLRMQSAVRRKKIRNWEDTRRHYCRPTFIGSMLAFDSSWSILIGLIIFTDGLRCFSDPALFETPRSCSICK